MSTRREQIILALKEALRLTDKIEGRVYRNHPLAFTKATTPALNIEVTSDVSEQINLHRSQWALSVRLNLLVKGDFPDEVADPIINDIHNRTMALRSSSDLAQLVSDVQPVGVSWQPADGDGNPMYVACDFRILYQTSLADISTL